MLAAIRDLREVAIRCSQDQPLGDRLGKWLAESLEAFLSHEVNSLEEALGLRAPRGGVPWWREEAIRIRDGLLRELARNCFAELPVSAKARQIRLLALRYGASAWRFDRDRETMPPHYVGTANAWLWQLFHAGAPMPISERHLRTILAGIDAGRPGKETDRDPDPA